MGAGPRNLSQSTPGGTGPSGLWPMDLRRLKQRPLRQVDLADHAFVQQLHRLDLVRRAAALRADLHHALVFARGLDHLLPFEDVVAGGLFDVDVLAGLAGPDGGERVPVVGQRHGDGVHVLVGEDLPHVGIALGLLLRGPFDQCLAALERRLVDIAKRGDAASGSCR